MWQLNTKYRADPVPSFRNEDVTLYIPCFDASATIGRCLAGIAAQTVKPAEVLLVDDGSKPAVKGAVSRIIRHDVNLGLGAARNTALRSCNTALLASLDADVVPAQDWLEKMLAAINREKADGAGGRVVEHFQSTLGDRWRAVHMAQHWGAKLIHNPRFLFGSNNLFRADRLREAGGYDEILRTNNEDRKMCDLLAARGALLIYTPDAVCRHFRRDTDKSILPGYWKWHHAAGLMRGDFDSPAGLIGRIERVNFGIYRYRFDMDRAAGRKEFLRLDVLLPWIFCAEDLRFYRNKSGKPVLGFPPPDLVESLPDSISSFLHEIIEGVQPSKDSASGWMRDYINEFNKCLERFRWRSDARVLG